MNSSPRLAAHHPCRNVVSAGVIVEPQVRVNRMGRVCPLGAPPINYSPRTKQGGTNAVVCSELPKAACSQFEHELYLGGRYRFLSNGAPGTPVYRLIKRLSGADCETGHPYGDTLAH
jgi:hypothetical protein